MSTPLPLSPSTAHNADRDLQSGYLNLLKVVLRDTGPDPMTPDRDWLLEVATSLQTTLDLEALIHLFSQHARRVVPHDTIEYENAAEDIHIVVGEPATHSVNYDLVLLGHALGELRFSRAEPFAGAETLALENILCNLIHPLRNALMYREALQAAARDPLTGLNNRFGLESVLDREVELARRHDTVLSVLMIDADEFKSINDEFGHLVGDAALRTLADVIARCTRDSDMVFRYGGEEFVVVLSNTTLAGAQNLAERIRRTTEQTTVAVDSAKLNLTVSIGVSTLTEGATQANLLKLADQALYIAKHNGRNQVATVNQATDPLAPRSPARRGHHGKAAGK